MATFKPTSSEHPAPAPRRALAGGFWRWLHGFYQTGEIQPAGSRRHPAPTTALRRARATR
jgi:hypothetical protein